MYHIHTFSHNLTISKTWILLFVFLAVWEIVWKMLALWKAATNKQLGWFIVLAILNTAGILEIVYIVFFQKAADASKKPD